MRLTKIGLHNYKSLRSVTVEPGSLAVLVGPNGAGKSNFCDALDFVGEMYQIGLELAVARHGGYENIAFRHDRRSKAPITIDVEARLTSDELLPILGRSVEPELETYALRHLISFGTATQSIAAPFRIIDEIIELNAGKAVAGRFQQQQAIFNFSRKMNRLVHADSVGANDWFRRVLRVDQDLLGDRFSRLSQSENWLNDTQSLSAVAEAAVYPFIHWSRSLGSIGLFQVSPPAGREPGVPTPQPQLGRSGSNLPSVVEFLREHRPEQFRALINGMSNVMPTLEDIGVTITPQRTQALTIKERGFRRTWSADEVSDGTIRALALLAAVLDPAFSLTVIEEPENSLHPWAIKQFLEVCSIAADSKQLVLTTHSPTLLNQASPDQLWVVSRRRGETHIDPLHEADRGVTAAWKRGDFRLADYLDSGVLAEAVPGTDE